MTDTKKRAAKEEENVEIDFGLGKVSLSPSEMSRIPPGGRWWKRSGNPW